MAFAFLNRFFGKDDLQDAWRPLFGAIVAEARQPDWYLAGEMPDTMDGRFEVLLLIASLVMRRLESLGEDGKLAVARLTELCVEDWEGQLREMGVGDPTVGKRVSAMVSALGGRLGAYREGLSGHADFAAALARNLYGGTSPSAEVLAFAEARARGLVEGLDALSLEVLRSGRLSQ